MSFENKVKFALWAYPETLKNVEVHYKNDNCRSQSEFIEKAIKFYIDYLSEEDNISYLSPIVKAQIKGTEQRLERLLFKVAVEQYTTCHNEWERNRLRLVKNSIIHKSDNIIFNDTSSNSIQDSIMFLTSYNICLSNWILYFNKEYFNVSASFSAQINFCLLYTSDAADEL